MIKKFSKRLLSMNFPIVGSFAGGSKRTIKAKKNVISSFFFKGSEIILSFLLLPITLSYINNSLYGIWLIISSITSWVGFFDIGLTNGLRNKLAEALAKNDKPLAKTYISTTYAILIIISLTIFLLFLLVNPFLNWTKVLNTEANMQKQLSTLMFIVFGFFCMRFVLKLITTILVANQKPAINNFVTFASKLLSFIFIIILTKTTEGSLIKLGFVFSFTPVLVLAISSIFFYSKDYREFIPSLKKVDFKYTKKLMNLGLRFFIIQIAAIILFTTDNMIITQLFGPSEVTVYNVAHKYFNIVLMTFTIILSPFWSSVTEAYHKNDIKWIKNSIIKLNKIWLIFVFITIFMLLFSSWIYKVWLSDRIQVPFMLSFLWAVYVLMQTYVSIYVNFINGVGKIQLQLYTSLFSIIMNVPLSVLFAKYMHFGVQGVIMGTMVSTLISLVLRPVQYNKIINNKASGIWDK